MLVVYFCFRMLKATPISKAPLTSAIAWAWVNHTMLQRFHCLAQINLFERSSFSLPSMALFLLFVAHAPLFSQALIAIIAFSSPLTPLLLLSCAFPHPSSVFYPQPAFIVLLDTVAI